MLHKDAASTNSVFFRKACSGSFKEASTKIISLPETDPEIFAIYSHWIYSSEVDVPDVDKPGTAGSVARRQLAALYILADHLDDKSLRNAVVDEYLTSSRDASSGPGPNTVKLVWSETPDNCKFRNLVLDFFVTRHDNGIWLERDRDNLPAAFYCDLALAFARAGEKTKPTQAAKCTYHEHDEENPSCSDS